MIPTHKIALDEC